MRAAVLRLAFANLSVGEAVSSAFDHNAASLAVSRKLGYQPDGIQRRAIRGTLSLEQRLRITRAAWDRHRTVPVTTEGLPPCLPLLGIDAALPSAAP
jgi:RimJ/RimL family protein N-acetyltransferase